MKNLIVIYVCRQKSAGETLLSYEARVLSKLDNVVELLQCDYRMFRKTRFT